MEALRNAIRTLTSKPVQRALVNAILIASGIGTLLGLAIISSALFFQAYLPHRVVTSPVYLQYGSSPNPYGLATLEAGRIKSLQDYDVSVTFTIPRSPANLHRGNFMVSMHLLDSREPDSIAARADEYARSHAGFGLSKVLMSSRRPALIPYIDPLVSTTSRVLFMAYHLLSSNSQRHTMTVKLAERVSFGSGRGSVKPFVAYIEIEAGQDIQIYSTQLTLTARLSGLRWVMVHYRMLSYIALTLLFWFFEVLFMSAAWSIWSFTTSAPVDQGKHRIKRLADAEASNSGDDLDIDEGDEDGDDDEDDDEDYDGGDDDTGKILQGRLLGPGRSAHPKREPGVKDEESPERVLADIPMAGADADDEDDLYQGKGERQSVSGKGTSFNKEGAERIRRRASQGVV